MPSQTQQLARTTPEPRKALFLLLQFYYKGYNSETARWKRRTGQETDKGCKATLPSQGTTPSQNFHVFTSLEGLQT